MSLGLILCIEDSEGQRMALKRSLELRNFTVEVAGDVETARRLIEKLREQIDVMVLDMRLEDPNWPGTTGVDIAIEYFDPQIPLPPEFIICTAYSEVEYYKLALKLGVVTYLQKAEITQGDFIRHIRSLAIRRLLSVKRPGAADQIRRIVESSRNRSEAIVKFCKDGLEPSFRERLGAPFILLFSEGDHTYLCAGDVDLPKSLGLYEMIQAMAFAEAISGDIFTMDAGKIPLLSGSEDRNALDRLSDAAFLPLLIDRDLRLSVGVLRADPTHCKLAEPPAEMTSILAKHLKSTAIECFLAILTKWNERHTKN